MDALKNYLDRCIGAKQPRGTFEGPRMVALMDEFGSALHSHLSNEPARLASLKEYPNIDMVAIKAKAEKDAMDRTSPVYLLPMLWCNLDSEFEDGYWKDFPGLSAPVRWVLVNVFGWWRSNWWRFGSVDKNGQRVQLLALRDDYKEN